jgi:hypothetical protein
LPQLGLLVKLSDSSGNRDWRRTGDLIAIFLTANFSPDNAWDPESERG